MEARKQQEEALKQRKLQSQRKHKKTGSISEEKQQEMMDDSSVDSMEMNSNGKRQRGVTQSPSQSLIVSLKEQRKPTIQTPYYSVNTMEMDHRKS